MTDCKEFGGFKSMVDELHEEAEIPYVMAADPKRSLKLYVGSSKAMWSQIVLAEKDVSLLAECVAEKQPLRNRTAAKSDPLLEERRFSLFQEKLKYMYILLFRYALFYVNVISKHPMRKDAEWKSIVAEIRTNCDAALEKLEELRRQPDGLLYRTYVKIANDRNQRLVAVAVAVAAANAQPQVTTRGSEEEDCSVNQNASSAAPAAGSATLAAVAFSSSTSSSSGGGGAGGGGALENVDSNAVQMPSLALAYLTPAAQKSSDAAPRSAVPSVQRPASSNSANAGLYPTPLTFLATSPVPRNPIAPAYVTTPTTRALPSQAQPLASAPPSVNDTSLQHRFQPRHLQQQQPQQELQQQLQPASEQYFSYNATLASPPAVPHHAAVHPDSSPAGLQMLRRVLIEVFLLDCFLKLADGHTRSDIEFCGVLGGVLDSNRNCYVVTHLLIPEQQGAADTCATLNEDVLFEYQSSHDLLPLGWIHTHPAVNMGAFLSSVDQHCQFGYQIMLPEAVAIVMAPKSNPDRGVFRLSTPSGMDTIQKCPKSGFHEHVKKTFELATHIDMVHGTTSTVVDLRNEQQRR
eukprot:ANDGO_04621.mRNA.1 putative ubiquitin thioesterase DG1039